MVARILAGCIAIIKVGQDLPIALTLMQLIATVGCFVIVMTDRLVGIAHTLDVAI